MFKQSFCWWAFKDHGVADDALLQAAARIGYAGVEFLPDELWPRAKDLGLAIATMAGQGPIHDGLNRRENHSSILEAFRPKLATAVAHGVPTLIVFSGNRQPGVSDSDAADITAEGLAKLAPLAEQAGVDIVLELLNSKVNHIGYQADSTAWGAEVCRRTGSPRVKLLYDIYHMQLMEGDLIRTIEQCHGVIGHYHTAGCPGRAEINDDQEIHYPGVFRAIARTGYTGYIGHELVPAGDPIAALKQAFDLTAAV